jgi:Holliday junction resolvase RusA-like endonuclease
MSLAGIDDAPALVLRVDGKPAGKGRPVFSRHGARVSARTPDATRSAEGRMQAAWMHAGRPRVDGPFRIDVEVVVTRPAAHWRVDGTLGTVGEREEHPIRRPDVDNSLKLVMDSLNGCAYRDDVAAVLASVCRRWANPGEHEHTVVRIWPMPPLVRRPARAEAA